MSRIVILTGVTGSGKTTIGRALAHRLDYPFFDGDDFHPPQNIAKMSSGVPLDDEDRAPWLQRLHELIAGLAEQNKSAIVACSALKKAYRRQLARGVPNVCFVYLDGSFELLHTRLQAREGHYMGADMLRSQIETLEPPQPHEAVKIDVDDSVERIVSRIQEVLQERCHPDS